MFFDESLTHKSVIYCILLKALEASIKNLFIHRESTGDSDFIIYYSYDVLQETWLMGLLFLWTIPQILNVSVQEATNENREVSECGLGWVQFNSKPHFYRVMDSFSIIKGARWCSG